MKRPTPASLKKVTTQNLEALGVERLAVILVEAAEARPELKRRLRMELAAEQGGGELAVEIDRRLASLETSRSKVSWRRRPAFVHDLDILRALIGERLASLDAASALDRLWLFMDLARRLHSRVKDKDGAMEAVFRTAAGDIGRIAADQRFAQGLTDAAAADPGRWSDWLPDLIASAPPLQIEAALVQARSRAGMGVAWDQVVRQLADAAGDVDAFRDTYAAEALRTPGAGAAVARRLLAAERIAEAGEVLEASRGAPKRPGLLGHKAPADSDFDWETVWIDYLDQSAQADRAQDVRWASFERTLSVERARAFTKRLDDFNDVEAEERAFVHAAGHPDFGRGLAFLMGWPALAEAARMIQAREAEADLPAEDAEAWAIQLRARQPKAAHILLRRAAAAALRRRELKLCDRLTQEADAISLE